MNGADSLTPEQESHVRIGEVLHYIWNPIGIYDEPWSRDTYSAKIPKICKMVIDGNPSSKIAAYLSKVSSESMGMGVNDSMDEKAAEVALAYGKKLPERE